MHDVVVRTLEVNALDKALWLMCGMSGGVRAGVRSSYYGEILSTAFDSNPDFMM